MRWAAGEDFVRIEVETALRLSKRIIPVLVHNTAMPRAESLPEPIRPLARIQALGVTHQRFTADAQGLIKALERALEQAGGTGAPSRSSTRRGRAP